MTDAGDRSLHAVPVRQRERPLGALPMLIARTGSLPDDDLHLAQALAGSAALSLTHWAAEPRRDDVITRVRNVIAAEALLELAGGKTAAHQGIAGGRAGRVLADDASRDRARPRRDRPALLGRTTMEPAAVLAARTEA